MPSYFSCHPGLPLPLPPWALPLVVPPEGFGEPAGLPLGPAFVPFPIGYHLLLFLSCTTASSGNCGPYVCPDGEQILAHFGSVDAAIVFSFCGRVAFVGDDTCRVEMISYSSYCSFRNPRFNYIWEFSH